MDAPQHNSTYRKLLIRNRKEAFIYIGIEPPSYYQCVSILLKDPRIVHSIAISTGWLIPWLTICRLQCSTQTDCAVQCVQVYIYIYIKEQVLGSILIIITSFWLGINWTSTWSTQELKNSRWSAHLHNIWNIPFHNDMELFNLAADPKKIEVAVKVKVEPSQTILKW